MTAVYLGVVLVPLLGLVWNLVPREIQNRIRMTARFRSVRRRFGPRIRRAWTRLCGRPVPPVGLGLAPDVPRSPSMAGWQPAPGYAAAPHDDTEPFTAA